MVMKEGSLALGQGQNPLAHRVARYGVVADVGGDFSPAVGLAREAGAEAPAGKRDPVALHLSCTGYNVGFD